MRPPSSREAAKLPGLIYDTTFRGDGALSMPERPSTSYSSVREVVQIVDDRILTFDPAEPDQAKAFVERGFLPPGTKRYKDRRFMFDKVFHDPMPLNKKCMMGLHALCCRGYWTDSTRLCSHMG